MVRQAWSLPVPGWTSWQAPFTHGAPPPHAKPQLPQLAASALTSFSQPLVALPSQSPKPTLHSSAHTPTLHAGVALAPPEHGVHEAPPQPWAGSGASHCRPHSFCPGQAASGLLPLSVTPPPSPPSPAPPSTASPSSSPQPA